VRRDFNLGTDKARPEVDRDGAIVRLSEFVVATSKEMAGAAIAINEQRFAPNIVDVVSAEEFGSVLESNPGDFLKYLPGITIDFIGGAAVPPPTASPRQPRPPSIRIRRPTSRTSPITSWRMAARPRCAPRSGPPSTTS
jgi:hypothetical protein